MKKTVKAAALLAAMALAAGFCACQGKEGSGSAPKYSAKDAEKTAGYLVMDGTTVLGVVGKDGLPAKLVIPEGVTEIGKQAFSGCTGIKSVYIPGSVTSIGENAFGGCDNLTSVFIPEGVTEIGKNAFSGCRKLASVTIPNTVTAIGEQAFRDTGLKSVTIPGSVEVIGERAFESCSELKSVTISEGVKEIGYQAFYAGGYSGTSLKSVSIPASVTFIAPLAFRDCYQLEEVKYAGTKAQWNEIRTREVLWWTNGEPKQFSEVKTGSYRSIGHVSIVQCADGNIKLD